MTPAQLNFWPPLADEAKKVVDMHSERQNGCETHVSEAASSSSSRLADDIDRALDSAGLPAETIVDGTRRCRHHPEHAIRSRAEPCPACRRAARGMFGPVVLLAEEGGAS
jgi:hypothetical protein